MASAAAAGPPKMRIVQQLHTHLVLDMNTTTFRPLEQQQQQQHRYFATGRRRKSKVQGSGGSSSSSRVDEADSDDEYDDYDYDESVDYEGDAVVDSSKTDDNTNIMNPGLQSVISQGISTLERVAADVEHKTRQSIEEFNDKIDKGVNPNPKQLMESQRIMDVTTRCIEEIVRKQQQYHATSSSMSQSFDNYNTHPTSQSSSPQSSSNTNIPTNVGKLICILGDPIVILHVEVNSNLKLAKVYWSLPYSILMDDRRIDQQLYEVLVKKMQSNLTDRGCGKYIQKHVHTILRNYYPPKLLFVPATNEMIQEVISELID